ncbi:MAG: hypothetical protein ACFFBV_15755 [Promethearchaeota archaeon]
MPSSDRVQDQSCLALILATGGWRFLANVLLLVALILLWLAYGTLKIARL